MDESQQILLPHFTPVPMARNRKDGWTPARQRIFLAALSTTGLVARAARAAEMGVTSAYALRKRKGAESFAAAWDQVEREARERALAWVIEHVTNGETVPRFYRGRFIGTVHRVDRRVMLAAVRTLFAEPPPRRQPDCPQIKVK
ncbi:hypothetical protein P6144_08415 [Sphingomonas sp. HITSZ_GF]|uniref:hypothetical protein n=1 Tax=Sphingomonas sp. HITSZ_GF TaxID=3037247 RepID=UPI00240D2944|nr:hypothetical protein [Sphingomonas sp. HITSZ_GF]MDG2533666.1 hypothetical protein [Sphingomonas sp. HITSZ_GF]